MKKILSILSLLLCGTMTFAQVKIADGIANGTVKSAVSGQTVTLTATPADGYYLESIEAVKTIDASAAARTRTDIPVGGDYTLTKTSTSADRSQAATYTLTLAEGYGAYVTASFAARTEITTSQIVLSAESFVYNGSDQKPTVSITGLTEGTDYTVSYNETSWKDAGTYTVTVTGIDTYKGTPSKTWTITPKTVDSPTITLDETSFEYTGEAIEPMVTVGDGENTIFEEEYTVSYKNNTEVGTATVTITDNEGGNYIVSGSTTFEITAPEKKVISDTNLVPIDGKNFYVPTEETLEAIKETFDASFGLFKEDVNRVELTEKGGLKFSKGSDIQMIVLGGNLHEIVKFVFTGKMYGSSKMLRQLKANTRGDGDASTDGDLELVSGADYEVIEDGDLILTIALEDEEAVIEGISVNKPDEPDEPDEADENDEDDDEEDDDEPEPTSVTIEIGKNGKTTYTGSEALDFSGTDDVKAYVATGYESDGTVWLTRVKQVPAWEPVLIKGAKNTSYEIPILNECKTLLMNMFMGSADEELTISTTSNEGYYQNFYMAGGKFKPVPEKYTLTAGKCYLSVPAWFFDAYTGDDQKVTISKSGKSSYAPPVDVDLTTVEGLKAYVATGYDPASQTIWLTRVMRIQAGEGVILKGEAGKTYTLPSKAVQAMYYSFFIANNEEKITINETSDDGAWTNFYLADGKFKKVSGTQEIGINKSYLVLPTWWLESNNSARGKKTAGIDELTMEELETETMLLGSIGGDDEDGTTRIDAIATDNALPDVYYNLQGQRVDTPKKGLYIKDGKKVVIK